MFFPKFNALPVYNFVTHSAVLKLSMFLYCSSQPSFPYHWIELNLIPKCMIQSINVVILFCITTIKLFEILTQQRAANIYLMLYHLIAVAELNAIPSVILVYSTASVINSRLAVITPDRK